MASNTPGIMSAFSVALCLLVCAQSGAPCEALAKAPEASGGKEASDDTAKADKAAKTEDKAKGDTGAWDVEQPEVSSREQAIEVTTGTWMSLDVSPDGEKIVFDLLGDLYLLPIDGGAIDPSPYPVLPF